MPKSKRKKRSKSKTGYIGVVKRSSGRYQAQIWTDGKMKNLGTYDTAKEATKAYDKEAIKLRKPFSKLNYPKKAPVGYTPIQQALMSTNTVGYRGVTKKNKKKFIVHLTIDGKIKHIGTYDTAKEAAVAYDRAVLNANRSTTLLNFPDMVHNLDVEPERKKYKRSSTGYRGVSKVKISGKFQTKISIKGKRKSLGTFDTAIAAALAYDQAAIKAGKKKSTLNFPDELPVVSNTFINLTDRGIDLSAQPLEIEETEEEKQLQQKKQQHYQQLRQQQQQQQQQQDEEIEEQEEEQEQSEIQVGELVEVEVEYQQGNETPRNRIKKKTQTKKRKRKASSSSHSVNKKVSKQISSDENDDDDDVDFKPSDSSQTNDFFSSQQDEVVEEGEENEQEQQQEQPLEEEDEERTTTTNHGKHIIEKDDIGYFMRC